MVSLLNHHQQGSSSAAPPAFRPPVPDSEVIARPRRRSFTAEYKRSILDQAEAAQDSGTIGALLRREGLYSSHLTTWKRQRQKGEIDALTPQKRGPKVVLILVSFQVETNYPGPCRQASQRLGVCRHLRQASFQLTHNPFH